MERVSSLRTGLVLLLVLTSLTPSRGGLRGQGKYSGVVIFDRWDTCFLLSGPYITYISQSVKERLRPYAGKPIQIDALSVYQPMNPGDALIRQYRVIGTPPDSTSVKIAGLSLQVSPVSGQSLPTFSIEISNQGTSMTEVRLDELGIAVIGKTEHRLSPSDGLSEAAITRADLLHPGWSRSITGANEFHASYGVQFAGPWHSGSVSIPSNSSFEAMVKLKISPGEYQFLAGYGGGVHETSSIASNLVSFAVDNSGRIRPR